MIRNHYPANIVINITENCNLSCKMCYLANLKKTDFLSRDSYKMNFPLGSFKKIIDELAESRSEFQQPINLYFSGGEPFLHPHLFEMIEYVNSKGSKKIILTIFTNLTLIDDNLLERLFFDYPKNCPDALRISLDGLAGAHNQMRGEGIFEKVFEAIKKIQIIKTQLKIQKPHLSFFCALNRLNYFSLREYIYKAQELGIDRVSFNYIQWSDSRGSELCSEELSERLKWQSVWSRAIYGTKHELGILKPDELTALIKNIKEIQGDKKKFKTQILFVPDFSHDQKALVKETEIWFSNRKNYKIDYCGNVFDWLRINYNGDVCPICCPIFYPFGNIIEDNFSLRQILGGERAIFFFNEIKNNGYFFACQRCGHRSDESRVYDFI